ncbi:MAG: 2-polyprenyl-3-methyl-6-methoxy-1,4-benzoquinone monooxygenase [Gammaproteobacteria bacterium]|nr:2-polyprenyl-3-methyl-6-methoxy-1,4-benzoquinone monooxygenase [Gammaproteobacteria bacterium]
MRRMSPLDHLLNEAGRWLSDFHPPPVAARAYPAESLPDDKLDESRKQESAAFMRVNHAGEIAAQGLYLGQALTARSEAVRTHMRMAAREETDHLRWCEQRLRELDSRVSWLTPFWGLGSLAIGVAAGLAGDRRSLGFVEETERQVGAHLESHLVRLPEEDARSRAVVRQMREDEESHRRQAAEVGAKRVPGPVRLGMVAAARVMTGTAYWL